MSDLVSIFLCASSSTSSRIWILVYYSSKLMPKSEEIAAATNELRWSPVTFSFHSYVSTTVSISQCVCVASVRYLWSVASFAVHGHFYYILSLSLCLCLLLNIHYTIFRFIFKLMSFFLIWTKFYDRNIHRLFQFMIDRFLNPIICCYFFQF